MMPTTNPAFELLGRIPLYVPGKPIQEVKRELGLTDIVKLASNENPWGPSEAVKERIRRVVTGGADEGLGLYPVSDGYYLRQAVARRRGVKTSEVILGNGSAELIEIAAKAVFLAGGTAVMPRHSFAIGGIAAQTAGGRVIETAATATEVDVDAILRAVLPDTRMVYLANANNPTGIMVPREGIERLVRELREDILLVVDQAYAEFEEPGAFPDAAAWLPERPAMLVLHTFSKIYALAALRIGYGLGSEWLMALLERVRSPFNTNHLAQVAAETAIGDLAFEQFCRTRNTEARTAFLAESRKHRCKVSGDSGNFLLMETALPAPEFFRDLLARGIIVRPMHGYALPFHVRVSMARPEDMEAFWAAAAPILDGVGCTSAG
jgi:histidinol-phosphate aminotransferase